MSLLRFLRDKWFDYTATICGHKTKRIGKVVAFGGSIKIKMPHNDAGSTDYCLDCIGKMTIRCAWCAEPIFISDPITLYTPKPADDFGHTYGQQRELPFVYDTDLGFKIPEHAVVYQRDPLQLVGCLRFECALTGADRAGFWVPGADGKGTVHRVRTAFEEILAGGGKGGIFVGDIGNPSEASPLQEKDVSIPIARTIQ